MSSNNLSQSIPKSETLCPFAHWAVASTGSVLLNVFHCYDEIPVKKQIKGAMVSLVYGFWNEICLTEESPAGEMCGS